MSEHDKPLAASRHAPAPRQADGAPTPHADDVAVDAFAHAMKLKLAKKRADGRSGWDDPQECTVDHLCNLLIEHCGKVNSAVDVANFAMMIWHRTHGSDGAAIPEANKAARLKWEAKRATDKPAPASEEQAKGGQGFAQPIFAELDRAIAKFPTWPTDALHALDVLGEEFGELMKEVLQLTYEPHKTNAAQVEKEALQTAAMALRFYASLSRYEYRPGPQHKQENIK